MERSPVHDLSPSSPPPPPSSPAPADTAGPFIYSASFSEHVQVNSRELAAIMDALSALLLPHKRRWDHAVSQSRGHYRAQS